MVTIFTLLGKKRKREDDDDQDYKDNATITKYFKKENGEKIIKVESIENKSENKSVEISIKREIRESQEMKISRLDVGEDISGPRLPINFPKIEFESDNEEQELIRKPKRKRISSLANSTEEPMNISSDSFNKSTNNNDTNLKNEDIRIDRSAEEERHTQREIVAAAAIKRFNNNPPMPKNRPTT